MRAIACVNSTARRAVCCTQYVAFWRRVAVGDFGPSLSAFPTPVSVLIARALPWTVGLLTTATIIAWSLGNLLGGLAGYHRNSRMLRVAGVVAMGMHPMPLLHCRPRAADHVRLYLADPADHRRIAR